MYFVRFFFFSCTFIITFIIQHGIGQGIRVMSSTHKIALNYLYS